MREWVKELNNVERDAVHEFEYLLNRQLQDKDEFHNILKLLPDEALLNGYGRIEFFRAYPFMRQYREKVVKNVKD